jgi:hypothetical protein
MALEDILIDDFVGAMIVFKLIRLGISYLAAYIARVMFSNKYVDSVVISNKSPPPMRNMVYTFMIACLLMEGVFIMCMALLAVTKGKDGKDLVPALSNPACIGMYLVDMAYTLFITFTVASIMGNIIGNRVVYEYVDQGTRASRSLELIIQHVAFAVYPLPYFFTL